MQCDRIAVINSGKIVELDTTEKIFAQAQHTDAQKLLIAAPRQANS